jgi:hypothetical protein
MTDTVKIFGVDAGGTPGLVTSLVGSDPSLRDVAAGDVSGDGLVDVVTVGTSGNVTVWKRTGSASPLFTPTTLDVSSDVMSPMRVRTGDVNGDGRNDAVVLGLNPLGGESRAVVLRQDGTGGLVLAQIVPGTGNTINDLAIGDLNGDGRADLIFGGARLRLAGSDAGGVFQDFKLEQIPVATGQKSVAIGDLNGDGQNDALFIDELGQLNAAYAP